MAKQLIFETPADFIQEDNYSLTYTGCTAESVCVDDIYIVGNGALKYDIGDIRTTLNSDLFPDGIRVGCWFYSTGFSPNLDFIPFSFNRIYSSTYASFVVQQGHDVVYWADGGVSSASIPLGVYNKFCFIEWKINFITGDGQAFVDNIPGSITYETVIHGLPTNAYLYILGAFGNSTGEYYIIDNLMITNNIEKSLWEYRGFNTYTPYLPADPPDPVYDIKFWLNGDSENGLIKCDPYGEADYTNGEWLDYSYIPKNFVGTEMLTGRTSIQTYRRDFSIDDYVRILLSIPVEGFRIGFWQQHITGSGYTRVWVSQSPIVRYDFGNGIIAWLMEDHSAFVTPTTTDVGFYEFNYDSTAETSSLWKNGELLGSITGISLTTPLTVLDYLNLSTEDGVQTSLFNRFIISTNPDLDMYNTEVGGIKICNLTEYPK
jgi:hypothetical protein